MSAPSGKLFEKLKTLRSPALTIYPLIIIISIPLLLIFNTVRNLNFFSRDVNHLLRHQAVSISETLKPAISDNLNNAQALYNLLNSAVNANDDLVSASVLKQVGTNMTLVSSTDPNFVLENTATKELGSLTVGFGFEQSYAGLNYDPYLQKNVWDVVVPLEKDDTNFYLLATKIKTDAVDKLLGRTSRDSILILLILIAVTIALLANHFVFYKRSMRTKQLEELGKLKDEFISMASHELQAPVAGLIGYLDILQDKIAPLTDAEIKEDVNILQSLTLDLRSLIDDLLNVSRIEQGRIKITPQQTQLNDVINKVITTLKPRADKKGLQIIFNPIELPTIQSDPDRLRQVMNNLVSNSIKYTLKGAVTIKTTQKDNNLNVSVSDTGIGVPPDQVKKMFTKFHRVKDEKTKEVRGTGLGLWITKKIVELLGGEIFVESIYGTGSTISFTLPATSHPG